MSAPTINTYRFEMPRPLVLVGPSAAAIDEVHEVVAGLDAEIRYLDALDARPCRTPHVTVVITADPGFAARWREAGVRVVLVEIDS